MNHDYSTAQISAALLASAKIILPFNLLFSAYGLWQLSGIATILSLLLTLWLIYLHIRIAFDYHIFQAFTQGLNPDEFDAALITMKLRKHTTLRTMQARCRGAITLWQRLLSASILQIIGLMLHAGLHDSLQ